MRTIIILFLISVFVWSCNKDKDLAEEEQTAIANYLNNNNITEKPTESGLYFIVQKTGIGKEAQDGDAILVNYTGTLLDGTLFTSSTEGGDVLSLNKGEIIDGWYEAIVKENQADTIYMREGDLVKLIIPSELAYGTQRVGLIEPYSTLIFEIHLVQINAKK